ncbi:sensor histidine kinase [Rhodoglobus sp.]
MIRTLSRGALITDVSIALVATAVRALIGIDVVSLWFVVLGLGLALAVRRLSPAIALTISWFAALTQMAFLLPVDGANLAILVVLFASARFGSRRVRLAGLVSTVVGSLLGAIYLVVSWAPSTGSWASIQFSLTSDSIFQFAVTLGGMLALLCLSWTAGLLARTQAISQENKRGRLVAEQIAAIEHERNQIARDMHDVVAHSLAVVIAQADGARYASAADPGSAERALSTISGTAREALTDVRLLLGQLRHSQTAGPQPGLADIASLVDQIRSAGLDVVVTETGNSPLIPMGQQITLYRIVQEALTNALRHGDTSQPAALVLDWGESTVTVSVTNDYESPRAGAQEKTQPHSGHGLIGMRERAQLTGAELTVQDHDSQFEIVVTMPVVR